MKRITRGKLAAANKLPIWYCLLHSKEKYHKKKKKKKMYSYPPNGLLDLMEKPSFPKSTLARNVKLVQYLETKLTALSKMFSNFDGSYLDPNN